MSSMPSSPLAGVLRLWSLALALSAVLAAAGERWPAPLPVQPGVVALLLAVPPLLVGLWLLARWRLPDPGRGESSD